MLSMIDRGALEHIQRIASETKTRFILYDTEVVDTIEHERILIVEPVSTKGVTDA